MSRETRPGGTYLRIIESSLQLFNEQGERNVSTNHIASHLGISPGNLYYHFGNKDEIVVQLFKRYSEELQTYLTQTELPDNIAKMATYMAGVYRVLWAYRFLFSDVNALLMRSTELLGEHNQFTRERVAPLIIKLLQKLNEKDIIEIDEIGLRDLSVNMWLITKYWFDFDRSLDQNNRLDERAQSRGVYRTLSLVRPYIQKAHLAEFDQIMADMSPAAPAR